MDQYEIAKREMWEKLLSPSSILLHGYFIVGIILFFIWGKKTLQGLKKQPEIQEWIKKPYRKYLLLAIVYIEFVGLWPLNVYGEIKRANAQRRLSK